MWTCQNDLSFSLYAIPSVCCVVTISENWTKFKGKMSIDVGCYCWTLEIEFNRSLSLLIIRLANYVITSLIYKSDLWKMLGVSVHYIALSRGFSDKILKEIR